MSDENPIDQPNKTLAENATVGAKNEVSDGPRFTAEMVALIQKADADLYPTELAQLQAALWTAACRVVSSIEDTANELPRMTLSMAALFEEARIKAALNGQAQSCDPFLFPGERHYLHAELWREVSTLYTGEPRHSVGNRVTIEGEAGVWIVLGYDIESGRYTLLPDPAQDVLERPSYVASQKISPLT